MYCKKCGQELLSNSTQCTKCGETTYIENTTTTNNNNSSFNECKLILTRKKAFIASLVAFDIYIDNVNVSKIKNGQTIELNVSKGQHRVSINNKNEINIMINGDTTANVVVFGANNYGIDIINGQEVKYVSGNSVIGNPVNNIKKSQRSSNSVLYVSIAISLLSIPCYLFMNRVINIWIYGIVIGYAFINMVGLKNLKNIDSATLDKLKTKNIIAIVISVIASILTIILTI